MKLKTITKPHKANLSEDYQLIQQSANADAQSEAMKEWIINKSKSTYIKISPTYVECDFVKDWIK